MTNTAVATNDQPTLNTIVPGEKLSIVLSGIVLTVSASLPPALIGAWISNTQLAAQADELRFPAAYIGLLASLCFIPLAHFLARKDRVAQLLCGIALCSLVLGACIGIQ
jgi:hypothetical protein